MINAKMYRYCVGLKSKSSLLSSIDHRQPQDGDIGLLCCLNARPNRVLVICKIHKINNIFYFILNIFGSHNKSMVTLSLYMSLLVSFAEVLYACARVFLNSNILFQPQGGAKT